MTIFSDKLIHYFVDRGLLTAQDVVERGVQMVTEHRERTSLQTVLVNDQPVFIVKRANDFEVLGNIVQEQHVYTYLQQIPAMANYIPPLLVKNARKGFIVLGWVNHQQSIDLLDQPAVLHQLGTQLGYLHSTMLNQKLRLAKKPWVLSMLSPAPVWQPEELGAVLSQASNLGILSRGLNEANGAWNPDALIHGDLKREHCLLAQDNGGERICLIDWELAGIGDSAWDVASFISDILFCRLYEYGERKHFEALGVEDALGSYLNSYAVIRPIDNVFLYKVALFTGGRLMQSSLESAAVYGSGGYSGVPLFVFMAETIFADLDSFVNLLYRGCTA